MKVRLLWLLPTVLLGLGLFGCSTDTELGGVRVPNSRPDTRMTGQPPTLLEAGYMVQFRWTGYDPDGRISGYQWKISDNGTDGISARDTLTFDPKTGAELHPWRFTTATDSVFLVLADQPDFPSDPAIDPRSFRSHTLFVRAVDETGAVDPTPAHISFTSTTLVPWASLTAPYHRPQVAGGEAQAAPPTVTMGYNGGDPDYEFKNPVKIRFLWKTATYINNAGVEDYVRLQYDYDADTMIDFEDPNWSAWYDFEEDPENRVVSYPNQDRFDGSLERVYYFFALQVQDIAGAVSVGRGYNNQVANIKIGWFSPEITIYDPFLGVAHGDSRATIAGGQPINFNWTATADAYKGEIVSYRYGWDLINPANPADTRWLVPPGLSESHRRAPEKIFQEGSHTFTLLVVDNSDQADTLRYDLEVIPFIDEQYQAPLLVLDQINDEYTSGWPDQWDPENTFYDKEVYRNTFWRETLSEGQGSVAGFNWEEDMLGHGVEVPYETVVRYKALVIYANFGQGTLFNYLRPTNIRENFNWLAPYQEQGGNVMMCGQAQLYGLVPERADYFSPLIFDTTEWRLQVDGNTYWAGFGTRETPEGEDILNGPLYYPYAVAGVSVMDWTAPVFVRMYGRTSSTSAYRKPRCASLKGLMLDEDFRDNPQHLVGPGEIADYIRTDPLIDWYDDAHYDENVLLAAYTWTMDEFYDDNISPTRPTPYQLQDCADGPGGKCVEPMFRGESRYDWLRRTRWDSGETDWPYSRYGVDQIEEQCGSMGLTSYGDLVQGSSLANGRIYGFLSYKNVAIKPRNKADVYWGFDPYRFDHDESKKAIRWVMNYFGLPLN